MTALALRSLWARRARSGLTAFVVLLGVALVVATLVLTNGISRAFDNVFDEAYRGTDAVVVGDGVVDSPGGRPDIPPDVLARIRAVPGVADASGQILDFTGSGDQVPLVRADGSRVAGDGNPTFGFGIDASRPRFNPFRLAEGRWPSGPREVVLDPGTARTAGVDVGDRVGAVGVGGVRPVTVVGIARLGGVDTIGGVTIAVFDVPTARALLGRRGTDLVSVAAAPGTDPDALAARLREVLPSGLTARTGAEQAAAERGSLVFVDIIRAFLLGFCAVSLLAGGIVIANALSITVAQRTRELATLRMIGATRRQVLRSVVVEALAMAVVASAAGVAAGYGLVRLMTWAFRSLGLDLPSTGAPLEGGVVMVGMAVGVGVTLLAALPPALRAGRVAPVAALASAAGAPERRRRADVAGVLGLAVAAVALAGGLAADGLPNAARGASFAVGVAGLLLAVACLAARLVRPLAFVAGLPARATGGAAGTLAWENARRDPRRTGAAAAALMVGLALVTFVALLGAGLKDAERGAVAAQVSADAVASADLGFRSLPPAVASRVASAPGVETATAIGRDRARVAGREVDVTGVDPAAIGGLYRFRGDAGPGAARLLTGDAALVTRAFADSRDLRVGQTVPVVASSGRTGRVRVAGIVDPPRIDSLVGDVVLARPRFDGLFPRGADALVLVRLRPGAGDSCVRAAVAGHPGAEVLSAGEFADARAADIDGVLGILTVLLGVAVVIACLGLAGTQALAVHERRREVGTLRAVGMTRRQARRMIRHESVITALIGAGLGVPCGVLVAVAVTRGALGGYGVQVPVAPVPLLVIAAVAVLAGLAAAVRPARRVARLDVRDALATE